MSKEKETASNLLRMADVSKGYLDGYDDAVNDILRWPWKESPELATKLVNEIAELNKSHHPVKIEIENLGRQA